jgi:hypothetical protein
VHREGHQGTNLILNRRPNANSSSSPGTPQRHAISVLLRPSCLALDGFVRVLDPVLNSTRGCLLPPAEESPPRRSWACLICSGTALLRRSAVVVFLYTADRSAMFVKKLVEKASKKVPTVTTPPLLLLPPSVLTVTFHSSLLLFGSVLGRYVVWRYGLCR